MESKSRYKSSLAFTDLLFNILIGFAFMFIIAFLLINPVQKDADIEAKAEFMSEFNSPRNKKLVAEAERLFVLWDDLSKLQS